MQMRNTISVRLPDDLAEWLSATARRMGVAKGRIVRQQLENARSGENRPFLRLAGAVAGPADLCLIRLSELHPKHPVITTDLNDFRVYRRGRC
jgi:predicted transcriptional regulator